MKWRRSTTKRESPRRPLTFGDWVNIILIILLLMLIGGYFAIDGWAHYRLDSELAKIRAAGQPVIVDDLAARDEASGAGVVYVTAFNQIDVINAIERGKWQQRRKAEKDEQGRLLDEFADRHQPLDVVTPEMEAEIRRIIAATGGLDDWRTPEERLIWEWQRCEHDVAGVNDYAVAHAQEMIDAFAEPLARLRVAAEMDAMRCTRAISYRRADPFISTAAFAGRLLTASTLVHLRVGRFDAAAREIVTLLRLRRVTEEPRTWPAQQADCVMTSDAAALISVLLPDLPAGSPWFVKLAAEMETAQRQNEFTRALIMERAKCFQYLQVAYEHDRAAVAYWEVTPGPLIRLDMANYLMETRRMIEMSSESLAQMLASFELDKRGVMWQFKQFESMLREEGRAVAMMVAARAAIGVERFRRDHGRLPQTLEELTPTYLSAAPIDPFTGRTMLFRSSDDVYVIYSVGRNGMNEYGAVWGRYTPDDGVRVRIK